MEKSILQKIKLYQIKLQKKKCLEYKDFLKIKKNMIIKTCSVQTILRLFHISS